MTAPAPSGDVPARAGARVREPNTLRGRIRWQASSVLQLLHRAERLRLLGHSLSISLSPSVMDRGRFATAHTSSTPSVMGLRTDANAELRRLGLPCFRRPALSHSL